MPSSSDDSTKGMTLPSGMRVRGPGADLFVERASAVPQDTVRPGPASNLLYAVQFTLAPMPGHRPSVERILDAVTEEIRQSWEACPRLVRDEKVANPPGRFTGMNFDFEGIPGSWTGEIVWRSVHPMVSGSPITTYLRMEERASFTRVHVRVTADQGRTSVLGNVGAGQAQPHFLRALKNEIRPAWLGAQLEPRWLGPGEVANFIHSVLEAADRKHPVVLLTPLEVGGFVLDPSDFEWELFGRAALYIIGDHRVTFELTDFLERTGSSRRMSCYLGAARAYMPGWSRYDNPFDHPLLVADRLADPVMRADWLGKFGISMAEQIALPVTLEEKREERARQEEERARKEEAARVAAEAAEAKAAAEAEAAAIAEAMSAEKAAEEVGEAPVTQPSDEADPAASEEPAATLTASYVDPPQLPPSALLLATAPEDNDPPKGIASDPLPAIHGLLDQLSIVSGQVLRLTDEIERLRTVSAVRSSSTNAIERRLARIEDILEKIFPDGTAPVGEVAEPGSAQPATPEMEDEGRPSLEEIVRKAAENNEDALLILDPAFTSASASPYEDPERVRAILDAMARVARRRLRAELGTSLKEAFADLGIDYRSSIAKATPERLRRQYRFRLPNGKPIEAEEHIVLGNTYDPRRCLRIYFSSRIPDETRFVIGHVGRHFEVISST